VCTDDGCDPAAGCTHTANTSPCDDGNACSTGDICADSGCKAVNIVQCDDGNPCTDDSCDVTEGCTVTDNVAPCDDADPCTLGDTCGNGACHPGPNLLGCDDGNPCTQDACAGGVGCSHTPDANLGDDCCLSSEDCGAFAVASTCDAPDTCQGTRLDPACANHICESLSVPDDTGCVDEVSDTCGSYPSVLCGGEEDQQAPACETSCTEDSECDADTHCDDGNCVPDVELGDGCDEDSDCGSGICQAEACCSEVCSDEGCGIAACDGSGACLFHQDGNQHGCDVCQGCDGAGSCSNLTVDGAEATALGCNSGDEGCRKCDGSGCGFYTSGQHLCAQGDTCNGQGQCLGPQFSGTIEMPAQGSVQGYSEYWQCENHMRTTTRIILTSDCVRPTISIHQHASSDTSIYGSYYITAEGGNVIDSSPFETHGGCNNCFLTPTKMNDVTLKANTHYHLGFQNDASQCDMSGPSVYVDSNSRTVGVATFDQPRMDQPNHLNRGLPGNFASWQNRWEVVCE
jgi:hypothetical protein